MDVAAIARDAGPIKEVADLVRRAIGVAATFTNVLADTKRALLVCSALIVGKTIWRCTGPSFAGPTDRTVTIETALPIGRHTDLPITGLVSGTVIVGVTLRYKEALAVDTAQTQGARVGVVTTCPRDAGSGNTFVDRAALKI